jgi:IS4 transposase
MYRLPRSYNSAREAIMVVHSDVFERFTQGDTIPVMTQAVMEKALSPRVIDQLFEDVAEHQYTRELLFSSIVELMSLVVCGIQPSINAAYTKNAVPIDASLQALYRKIGRVETQVASALVRKSDERLAPVIAATGGERTPFLPGYRTKILDGNHLPGTEHRILELRTMRAAALPGHGLVVFDPQRMTAIDVVLCEDGHAQERSLLDEVLRTVAERDLWIADRNFCTTDFLFGIAGRGGFFVIRQHASTLHYVLLGKRKARGRVETGRVYEQTLRAVNDAGDVLFLRRVTMVLDKPTRDGDIEIHLLTNLPAKDARARVVAELYRRRWTIETAFQELEATLEGEIDTLGYPKAALFAFCVALVSYNVMSTVKAALRGAHGAAAIDEKFSGYYLVDEVRMTYRGMMRAIPKDEWVEYQDMPAEELAATLVGWARTVPLSEYRKSPRGPKKPKPKKESGAKIKHVATARVLKGREECAQLQV